MNWLKNAINSGYFCYMAEAEGMDYLVNTREAKVNAIINDLKATPRNELSTAPNACLMGAAANHGIDWEDLSFSEIRKIEKELNK